MADALKRYTFQKITAYSMSDSEKESVASIQSGRTKRSFPVKQKQFTNSELRALVAHHFPEFRVRAFDIMIYGSENMTKLDEDDCHASVRIFNGDALMVQDKSKPFSHFKSLAESLECFTGSEIPEEAQADFAALANSAQLRDDVLNHCIQDLNWKSSIYNLFSGPESTRRVYIDSILMAAALCANSIKLQCELTLQGPLAHGHVDWVFMYKEFGICITEAKKEDMEAGMSQATAQMHAMWSGNTRKRKNRDLNLPIYGIATTYTEWYFMKMTFDSPRPKVTISESMRISSVSAKSFTASVERILKTIVGVLSQQKANVDIYTDFGTNSKRNCRAAMNGNGCSPTSSPDTTRSSPISLFEEEVNIAEEKCDRIEDPSIGNNSKQNIGGTANKHKQTGKRGIKKNKIDRGKKSDDDNDSSI